MKILKDYLKENQMTQTELALRVDTSKKHICNLVNGKVKINERMSIKLSYVFWTEMFCS